MNINQAFPSNFLRESDLGGQDRTVTIREVKLEDVGDGQEKPVVYFHSIDKGLVLNKTNANTIAAGLNSDETNDWKERSIIMFPTTTEYKGRTTPCIRVRVAPVSSQAANPLQAEASSVFPPDV